MDVGRRRGPAGVALLHGRLAPRPGRRGRGPRPGVQLRRGRGHPQPHQAAEGGDVRPRETRPPPQAHTAGLNTRLVLTGNLGGKRFMATEFIIKVQRRCGPAVLDVPSSTRGHCMAERSPPRLFHGPTSRNLCQNQLPRPTTGWAVAVIGLVWLSVGCSNSVLRPPCSAVGVCCRAGAGAWTRWLC